MILVNLYARPVKGSTVLASGEKYAPFIVNPYKNEQVCVKNCSPRTLWAVVHHGA